MSPHNNYLHGKGRALTERIERLAKETGEAAEQHQQEETAARKKKAKVEVELAAVVGKYDRDMAEKTTQIEEIKVCESTALLHGSPDNSVLLPFRAPSNFDYPPENKRDFWSGTKTLNVAWELHADVPTDCIQ